MFRVITENKNQEGIEALLDAEDMDYTAYPANGCYHGHPEEVFIIDLEQPRDRVMMFAQSIAELNSQESVMVQEIPSEYTLVTPED